MPEKINIRGVKFDNVTFEEAVYVLTANLEGGKQTALCTPNSEIVQACIENNELYDVINSADLIIPDGIGVVKAGRILGTPFRGGKVAGCEVGEELIKRLAGTSHGVYFLGGKPGVAEDARDRLTEKYPGWVSAGCGDGYFKKEGGENDRVIEKINESGAEVLYVCFGCPAQEKWIYANRSRLPNVKLLLGLGGSLDVYGGHVKRAPKIFIKLGLEWFYRLITDPKRIGRMMALPRFYIGTWVYKFKKK